MKPRALMERLVRHFSSSCRERSSSDQSRRREKEEEADLEAIAAREHRSFSYETLSAATRAFAEKNRLGQGGFGPVYRGRLEDGREVAVKRLGAASRQGAREFRNEATLLSRVQHRNVVNLIGYCARGADDKLLVYEYVPNESLDKILFSSPGNPGNNSHGGRSRRAELTWPRRHEVVVGVARGLLYLHEDAHTPIIHRDIKASNILLDDRWVPKIADFGMARLFPEAGDGRSRVHTRVAGTNGYMAPEYLMHGDLSTKADVFSFGVVVLEIISSCKNSSFVPPHDSEADTLLEYAWRLYKKGRSLELLDPAVKSSAVPEQVELCVRIGLLCVQADPRLRPDMKRVVIILSKKQSTLEEPTRPGVPGSRYRRRSHGLRGSHYSAGSSSGTSSPSTSATSHASASASNAMTTSSTQSHTMRSQGLPSHREEHE
ncbi:cysteine-rich receptor-like protein kinase 43 [Phragmites australis]|uniref:cysteine-rich receptor-like protein kinase 43 n=1 Tax=Phragmites australis TaxID=29695 RepID=UPI002D78FAB6|nr:cysteine-rich receptor-like protein kinase 43 [Phragmites australis]